MNHSIENEMAERFRQTYPDRILTKTEKRTLGLIIQMALPRIAAGERYNWNPGTVISLTFHTAEEELN